MRYQVEYRNDGDSQSKYEEFDTCKDAGMAFARCQKLHPGAKMIHCMAFNEETGYGTAQMPHDPPPVQRDPVKEPRPCRAPKPNERDGVMPFYDEVRNR